MIKQVVYVLIADNIKILGVFDDRPTAITEQTKLENCSWFKTIHKSTSLKETFMFKKNA